MADPVQPEEGQGETGTGIFDSYLQTVPEDGRDAVMGYLKDAEANVNGRLAEAAELRKTITAFEEAGITQYDPQALSQLVQWNQQVTASPEAWQDFITAAAKEAGVTVAEAEAIIEAEPVFDPGKVTELLDQRIAPLQDWVQQQEFDRTVERERSLIDARFTALQKEHKIELTEEQRQDVLDLGNAVMPGDDQTMGNGHDWVGAGWDRWQKMSAQAQKALVDDKLKQPKTALAAGGTEQQQPTNDFATARERALEKLRQSHAT